MTDQPEPAFMRSGILSTRGLPQILAALPRARLVGGCVRDTLAGVAVTDIDLAVPDAPEKVVEALTAAGLRSIPSGIAHGTVTALSGGRPFEITSLRRDVETDGRHAQVVWTDSWEEDAARRDFTINAMSMDRDGTVHDHFGGRQDLADRRVKFVGDAGQRIIEDRLRVLRFFRFHARYGAGDPDADAIQAITVQARFIGQLSAERVWSELKRILAVPDPAGAVAEMDRTGVLAALFPDGSEPARLARMIAGGAPPDPLLRLAALATGDATSLATRLKLSGAERDRLTAMRAVALPNPGEDAFARRRLLAADPASVLIDRTWLACGFGSDWDALRSWLAAEPRPVFPLEGRDLLKLGLQPGPMMGEILRAVRAWWLEGGCIADRGSCLERAGAILLASRAQQ